MTILGPDDRGKFRAVTVSAKGGQAIMASIGGAPTSSSFGKSSLVTSFSVMQAENYAVSQCLNGGIFLYSYGHDPQRSHYTLGITSFLRACDDSLGSDMRTAIDTYSSARVSASKVLSHLSIGDASLSGYLIGQNIEVVDSGLSLIRTAYTFIALQPQ